MFDIDENQETYRKPFTPPIIIYIFVFCFLIESGDERRRSATASCRGDQWPPLYFGFNEKQKGLIELSIGFSIFLIYYAFKSFFLLIMHRNPKLIFAPQMKFNRHDQHD